MNLMYNRSLSKRVKPLQLLQDLSIIFNLLPQILIINSLQLFFSDLNSLTEMRQDFRIRPLNKLIKKRKR